MISLFFCNMYVLHLKRIIKTKDGFAVSENTFKPSIEEQMVIEVMLQKAEAKIGVAISNDTVISLQKIQYI